MICGEDEIETSKINLKKCIRKGDVICYTKPENINMKQTRGSKTSHGSNISAEKVQSGESLYKTFTFEQGANNEEIEKCIAFWKSVMENNLQPVKCTIIENKNKKLKEEEEKQTQELEERLLREEQEVENKMKQIHEDYRNLWLGVMKDFQRKRLHEVKLIGQARCAFCDSLSSVIDDKCKVNKTKIREEIKQLRILKADSKRTTKSLLIGKTKRTDTEEKLMHDTEIDKDKSKEESMDYEFIDVIEEKKNNGTYSAWRSNNLTCPCGLVGCTCDLNPAIISFTTPSAPPATPIVSNRSEQQGLLTTVPIDTDEKDKQNDATKEEDEIIQDATTNKEQIQDAETEYQQDNNMSPKNMNITESDINNIFDANSEETLGTSSTSSLHNYYTKSILKMKGESRRESYKPLSRVSVVLKNCSCKYADCDCLKVEELQREQVEDLQLPPPPPIVPSPVKRDSLTLFLSKKSIPHV